MKVMISTTPFAVEDKTPLSILNDKNYEIIACPKERKFNQEEFNNYIESCDALIAGTEPLNEKTIGHAKNLKLISRIGIGLDSVDLEYCKKNNIAVAYTPDGPTDSVVELTFGLLLDLARIITKADQDIKTGNWQRHIGLLLKGKTLGIIGMGRIGKKVSKIAKSFGMNVLVHDLEPDKDFIAENNLSLNSKEDLLRNSDFVTIHIPKTESTLNYIAKNEFEIMKNDSILINTARGGIVNEDDLIQYLENKKLRGAGLDVFNQEPFNKNRNEKLASFQNVILTAHMGSCTEIARREMEIGASMAVVDFFNNSFENKKEYQVVLP